MSQRKTTCDVCAREIGAVMVSLNDERGYRARYCSGTCLSVDATRRGIAPKPHNADIETLTGDDKLLR